MTDKNGPFDVGSGPRGLAKPADWRGRRPLVHFLKKAGLSKVTRPSPKGGRNPVEGPALASCTAPAVPSASAPSSPTLLPQGEKGAKTITGTGPSPARGEGSKGDLGNRPPPARGEGSKGDLGNRPPSREGRRGQRRSREQAPLPPWEKEAKAISGMIPSPVGRGSG